MYKAGELVRYRGRLFTVVAADPRRPGSVTLVDDEGNRFSVAARELRPA